MLGFTLQQLQQFDKGKNKRKSPSPANTSNIRTTPELRYVDILARVNLSSRSQSACLEKKLLATETSVLDSTNLQTTASENIII